MESKIVLDLMPHENNGRNSEGAFVQLKDGRILFVYSYYTSSDANDNAAASLAACYSSDNGETWTEPEILIDRGPADNVMSVSLLRLQSGKIAMLYLQKFFRRDAEGNVLSVDCLPTIRFSEDEAKTWSDAKLCLPTAGYYVINNDRMVQLKSGRLLLPMGFHRGYGRFMTSRAIDLILASDDDGATWFELKGWVLPPQELGSGLQEPGLLELNDGRLMLWARTDGGYQYRAFSDNGGDSWSVPEKYLDFPGPCAPLSIRRNPADGSLVAVWCDHSERRKQFPQPEASSWGRTPFAMMISYDDGKTWTDHLFIGTDPRVGYCYTGIFFTQDNSVLLSYCCGGVPPVDCVLSRTCIRKVRLAE